MISKGLSPEVIRRSRDRFRDKIMRQKGIDP